MRFLRSVLTFLGLALIMFIPGTAAGSDDTVFETDQTEYFGLDALTWTKYPGNPVIPEFPVGTWNHWKSDPFVMKDGGIYRMWYGTNADGAKTEIGYAESVDGIDWVHHPSAVVFLGADGEWDDEDVETPTVVKHQGIYHLWYSGRGEPEGTNPILHPDAAIRIGHAVSLDGIHWIKDPRNPVVDVGRFLLGWDWLGAAEPSVVVVDGVFQMWYTGVTIKGDKMFLHIGHATSPDGSNWTKFSGNPILSLDVKNGITTASVLYNEPYYELWAVLFDERKGLPSGPVGYATSLDGINWDISPEIVLSKGDRPSWDWWGIFGPTVLLDGGVYKMWYTGVSIDLQGVHLAIGHATATP